LKSASPPHSTIPNLFCSPHGVQLISPMGFRGTDFRSTCIYCARTIFTLECKRSSSSPSCCGAVCIFLSRHLLILRRNCRICSRGPFNVYEYIIIELRTMHAQIGLHVFTQYNFIRHELSKLYQLCVNYCVYGDDAVYTSREYN